MTRRPRVTLLYHFFHPDEVVSARQFSDLAAGLAERGWDVTAYPSNRNWQKREQKYPAKETWNGVSIRRIWRPGFSQSKSLGRIINTFWVLMNWCLRSIFRGFNKPDVVIIGTDPILSIAVAPFLKLFQPRVKVAHWLFDVYPEAAVADGLIRKGSFLESVLKYFAGMGYRKCDMIADIGPCMRDLVQPYKPHGVAATLVPWALKEPEALQSPDAKVRRDLFGDAKLALLYSGSFGRAHSYEEFLALARALKSAGVVMNFAGRGHCADLLKKAITSEDNNVRFAGFASESELELRLTAADIHLASLRPEWTGLVVPSKFFGSLACGRPVLFSGGRDSAIARWITEHQIGWVITNTNVQEVAEQILSLSQDSEKLQQLQKHCRDVYQKHFARKQTIDTWNTQLRGIISPSPAS